MKNIESLSKYVPNFTHSRVTLSESAQNTRKELAEKKRQDKAYKRLTK